MYVPRLILRISYPQLTCFSAGVDSLGCKEHNTVRSRAGALVVLRDILALPIDTDNLPALETATGDPDAHQTIVEAPSVGRAQDVKVEQASPSPAASP